MTAFENGSINQLNSNRSQREFAPPLISASRGRDRKALSDLTNRVHQLSFEQKTVAASSQRPWQANVAGLQPHPGSSSTRAAMGSSWRRGKERMLQPAPHVEKLQPLCRLVPVFQTTSAAPPPLSLISTTRRARPSKKIIRRTEYDPNGGVLRGICVDLFERAYGLQGKSKEDHAVLFRYAHAKTSCSLKAFEDLLYGHTYHKECAELRRLVPGYKEKPPPKPDIKKDQKVDNLKENIARQC